MMWEMNLQNIFLDVVNLSITASWVIAVVLLLRLILKPVPKSYVYLLWIAVLIRLLCPITIESDIGLLPKQETLKYEIVYTTPQVETKLDVANDVLDQTVNPMLEATSAPNPMGSVNPLQIYIFVTACVWVIGMVLLCGYTVVSWISMRRRLAESIPDKEHLSYLCANITSPFVFGFWKPKIYLPYGLTDDERRWVLKHEQSHLERMDFFVKPIFWLAVMVHWMNPLVWAAWYCYSRDMEFACDELATDDMSDEEKRQYSRALVQLAEEKRQLRCPVAFSNNSVKVRIKRVLEYKKLPFVVMGIVLIVMLLLSVGLFTDKKIYLLSDEEQMLIENGVLEPDYEIECMEIRWGGVSAEITDQKEIMTVKTQLDNIEMEPMYSYFLKYFFTRRPMADTVGLVIYHGIQHDESLEPVSKLNFGIYEDGKIVFLMGQGVPLTPKNKNELNEILAPYYLSALQQYPDTTFYADLNHDGEDEMIILNLTEQGNDGLVQLAVYEADGRILFSDDLYSVHSGWDNYFLLERDGKDYLVEFMPSMYQGYATYSWRLLDFDRRDKLRVVEEDAVDFTVNPQQFEFDVEAIYNFIEGAERVIRPAMLLVSTDQGELRYSTVSQPQTLTAESFITNWLHDSEGYRTLTPEEREKLSLKEKLQMKQDDIYYEKLRYELDNWMWEKQHISTAEKYFDNPQIIEIDGTRCVSFEWRWYPDSLKAGALIDIYAITAVDLDDFMQINAGYNYYRYDTENDEWILLDNSAQSVSLSADKTYS